MMCGWCAVNSGLTHAFRECCKLRRLAQAPRHDQAAYAATLTLPQREELRPLLVTEMKRIKGLRK